MEARVGAVHGMSRLCLGIGVGIGMGLDAGTESLSVSLRSKMRLSVGVSVCVMWSVGLMVEGVVRVERADEPFASASTGAGVVLSVSQMRREYHRTMTRSPAQRRRLD
jgi:hypothetical protein